MVPDFFLYLCTIKQTKSKMTRVNSAIPVRNLTDEHLLAEHREIKRLPHNLKQVINSGSLKRMPKEFKLGSGHVLFFLNKMTFIKDRYVALHQEAKRRGFAVQDFSSNWTDIEPQYWNGHEPTNKEKDALIARITERITTSRKTGWHYCGEKVNKEEAIAMLKES